MARFVHLAPEVQAASIRRSGIRLRSRSRYQLKGVYCMPLLPNFFACHQRLRELRRRGQRAFVAVDFRIPDQEHVLVCRYCRPHAEMTAAEAADLIHGCPDPLGYEVVVPRRADAREITRIRPVPQVTGSRYFPGAHGRAPCPCPACLRPGEYKAADLRRRLGSDREGSASA
jgi:hypothetical protein